MNAKELIRDTERLLLTQRLPRLSCITPCPWPLWKP